MLEAECVDHPLMDGDCWWSLYRLHPVKGQQFWSPRRAAWVASAVGRAELGAVAALARVWKQTWCEPESTEP